MLLGMTRVESLDWQKVKLKLSRDMLEAWHRYWMLTVYLLYIIAGPFANCVQQFEALSEHTGYNSLHMCCSSTFQVQSMSSLCDP